MIELVPTGAENIIGFRLSGKFDTGDFEQVTGIMEEKFKEHEKLRVYAEIESFEGMSLQALAKDITFSLKHFRDFEKEAVVTDKAWIGTLARISDKIIPTIEVKHFSTEEKEEALEWLKH
jgi:hypothetical protein